MRHGNKNVKLNRTAEHRKALMMNLANALIEHKRIQTTEAKAKALRVYIEPLITKAKNDTLHNRRLVFRKLKNKEAIKELFGPISDKVADRPGGYTRIIKLQARRSDSADLALIELVDFNELYTKGDKPKTRRTRRGRRKSTAANQTEQQVENTEEVTTENTEIKAEEAEKAEDTNLEVEENTDTEENTNTEEDKQDSEK